MTASGGVYLIREENDLPLGVEWLSARERATLAGLRFPGRRRDWLLGRWTAKQTVLARLPRGAGAPPPALVEILAAADGAPEALVGRLAAPCHVSLSHRAGVAFCVACDTEVGCDVERVEPRDAALVEDYFTPAEAALVAAAGERDLVVALVWSAKESALKLLRSGLRRDTRSLEVVFGRAAHEGWSPLEVACAESGRSFPGWWRSGGESVFTVVHASPCAPPVAPLEPDWSWSPQPPDGRNGAGIAPSRRPGGTS